MSKWLLSSLIAITSVFTVSMKTRATPNKPPQTGATTGQHEVPAVPHDLSGIWEVPDTGSAISAKGVKSHAPLTPWGEEVAKTHKPGDGPNIAPIESVNDPLDSCDPAGFPRNVLFELRPLQIVQTSNQVLILYQYQRVWRVIWTDGRALPKVPQNADPSWYGYSVGKWDGDTLVVETVGMDERTWLDNAGNPHSADLRVEERYRRVDHDTIEYTVKIDDPKTYTQPWLGRDKIIFKLQPANTVIQEMICVATEAQEYKKKMVDPLAK